MSATEDQKTTANPSDPPKRRWSGATRDAVPTALPSNAPLKTEEQMAAEKARNEQLTEQMLSKLTEYLNGTLTVTVEDYQLLQKLNDTAAEKYKGIADKAAQLTTLLHHINSKYDELRPYLDQIDQLEQNIMKLDHVVDRLDDYSRRLESQFQKHYSNS